MAQAVVDEIRAAGGEAVASSASVSSDDGPGQIVETAMDTWGRIDGLIHNAAIVLDDHFEDVTDDDLDNILAVNLRGTFRTVRAVYRAMKDSGGGRIVTLTSASGLSGAFGQAAYATTKMGVVGITRSVAWEGMRFSIKSTRWRRPPSTLGCSRYSPPTVTPRCAIGHPNSRSLWIPRNTWRC